MPSKHKALKKHLYFYYEICPKVSTTAFGLPLQLLPAIIELGRQNIVLNANIFLFYS